MSRNITTPCTSLWSDSHAHSFFLNTVSKDILLFESLLRPHRDRVSQERQMFSAALLMSVCFSPSHLSHGLSDWSGFPNQSVVVQPVSEHALYQRSHSDRERSGTIPLFQRGQLDTCLNLQISPWAAEVQLQHHFTVQTWTFPAEFCVCVCVSGEVLL